MTPCTSTNVKVRLMSVSTIPKTQTGLKSIIKTQFCKGRPARLITDTEKISCFTVEPADRFPDCVCKQKNVCKLIMFVNKDEF